MTSARSRELMLDEHQAARDDLDDLQLAGELRDDNLGRASRLAQHRAAEHLGRARRSGVPPRSSCANRAVADR
jgi:hypothetical protein